MDQLAVMKAAFLHKPHEVVIQDVPTPTIQSNEVLVQVKSVGICGSDFHYWRTGSVGNFTIKEPFILGHEVSGQIVEVGGDVSNFKTGDRVIVEPGVACGRCPMCRLGRYNLCRQKRFMGDPP